MVLFFAVTILLYGLVNRAVAYRLPEFGTLALLSDKQGVAVKITPIMAKLAMCESSNNEKAINPHDGGSPSYGLYQFKRETWVYFVRKYSLFPDAEDVELQNLIMDRKAQNIVTSKVLEDKSNRKHWINCFKTIDEN